jgi:anti-sigma factor RsiW
MTEPTDDIILRLTAYLDGELSPEQRAALEQEALVNPELAALLEEARDAMGVVAALPEVQAPDNFELAVQRRIRRRSGGRFFAGQRVRQTDSSVLFILIALTVLLAWFLFMRQSHLGPLLDGIAPAMPSGPEPEGDGSSTGSIEEQGSESPPSDVVDANRAADPDAVLATVRPTQAPHLNPRHRVPRYVLHARPDLSRDELERELVRRVGRQKLTSVAGGEWQVLDEGSEAADWAVRLHELGTIEEQRVLVNSPRDTVPLTVVVARP